MAQLAKIFVSSFDLLQFLLKIAPRTQSDEFIELMKNPAEKKRILAEIDQEMEAHSENKKSNDLSIERIE